MQKMPPIYPPEHFISPGVFNAVKLSFMSSINFDHSFETLRLTLEKMGASISFHSKFYWSYSLDGSLIRNVGDLFRIVSSNGDQQIEDFVSLTKINDTMVSISHPLMTFNMPTILSD